MPTVNQQVRTFTIDARANAQRNDGLTWMAISSEEPYERWWGIEVLDHSAEAVDLSRIADGRHPLLLGHDWEKQIGVMRQAELDEKAGKLRCGAEFSKSQFAQEIKRDVEDEIRTLVSVGYEIETIIEETTAKDGAKSQRAFTFPEFEAELQRKYGDATHAVNYRDGRAAVRAKGDEPIVYRVTRWCPFEGSVVPIPADTTVGVGRSTGVESPAPAEVVPVPAPVPAQPTIKEKIMTTETIEKPAVDVKVIQEDTLKAERARIKEIEAAGASFNQRELASQHIEKGTSVDAFNILLLKTIRPSAEIATAEDPALGMTQKEINRFSFVKALLHASNPQDEGFRKAAAFEIECSQATRNRMGDLKKDREGGICVPVDVLSAPSGGNPALARAMTSALLQRMGVPGQQRDLVVGTTTAGGHTVATDLLGASFIDILVNEMVVMSLGTTLLTDLNGNIAIPRQTGKASTYWVAENGSPTESQQAFDQVTLSPKTVGAFTDYSRRLLLQSSLTVEAFVRMDLARAIALAIDLAAIAGTGTSNQPTGILATSGIGSVAGGTNGLAPTWDHMVDLESAVANVNASAAGMRYLTNTKVRGKLKRTQAFSGTNGDTIWKSVQDQNAPVAISNQVPSNLTKGTSSGVCSAIIYGNFRDLLIGMWGGLDLLLDPYTGSTAGTKRLVALQDLDISVRHPESFSSMQDALTV